MVATATRREPTSAQLTFMYKLAGERQAPKLGSCGEERIENLGAWVENERPDIRKVSGMIDWLKARPRDTTEVREVQRTANANPDALQVGVYRREGEVYVVRWNKAKTHKYALRAVESSPRLTEAGTVIDVDFEYERGAIFHLLPEHRLSQDEAAALSVRYGKCIMCARKLKVAKSVERMMGPVCWKNCG